MPVQQITVKRTQLMVTPLTTRYTFTDNVCTFKLTGSIDTTNHHLLWSVDAGRIVLQKMLEGQVNKLVVDLTKVQRIDSQGLRHLHDLYRLFASANIQLVLKNPNSHLYRIFQIMQFDKIWIIEFDNS